MILLDTNVLSALMRPRPDAQVVAWLDSQPRTSIWTTSITVFEIRFGLEAMPHGKHRSELLTLFEKLLVDLIQQRIAHFDSASAQHAAELMAHRQRKGRPIDLRDTMIAGIVLATHATLATGNAKHFADISHLVIDPWST